jgi:cyclopropane fatty-acyl-phospholipid synthase-like methyltransferase
MRSGYVHGCHPQENERLRDQAGALVELLHGDMRYPGGSSVLEVGCGVGAPTIVLARHSPEAGFASFDLSADSIAKPARGPAWRMSNSARPTSSPLRLSPSPFQAVAERR